jgi:predicted enzyme related to lactoylglutathione lyase
MSVSGNNSIGWLRGVIYDCRDHRAMCEFYRRLLGVEIQDEQDGWLELAPGSSSVIMGFTPVDPSKLEKVGNQRVRIDIEVDDLDVANAKVLALGATLVQVVHVRPDEEHRIYADPEGNEFNLVLPIPDNR